METINKNFVPIEPIHPSELVKDELKARGMQKKELAERLGMKAPNLSRFFKAKEDVTPAMALKLESALGIPADYWIGLQLSYNRDLEAIRQRDEEENKAMQIESALSKTLNLSILFKELSLGSYKFVKYKLAALYDMFHVKSMEELLCFTVAQGCFKRSEKLETNDRNLNTWILLARRACNDVGGCLPSYDKGSESDAAKEIASLANAQEITENYIKDILNRHGIGYCVVEKFEKTPVDAYSAIIKGHPFIVVSHRKNNMDMLVFDILHECGHINMHLSEGGAIISYNQNLHEANGIEQEANDYAKDMLIPPAVWARITRRGSRSLNPNRLMGIIAEEAEMAGISPTIAAWRFKYETGNYKIPGYKSKTIR